MENTILIAVTLSHKLWLWSEIVAHDMDVLDCEGRLLPNCLHTASQGCPSVCILHQHRLQRSELPIVGKALIQSQVRTHSLPQLSDTARWRFARLLSIPIQ